LASSVLSDKRVQIRGFVVVVMVAMVVVMTVVDLVVMDPEFVFLKVCSKVRKNNGKFDCTIHKILTLNNSSQSQMKEQKI
jgi:hypothetical protein